MNTIKKVSFVLLLVFTNAMSLMAQPPVPTITPLTFKINNTSLDPFTTIGTVPSGAAGCSGGNADDDMFFSFVKPAGVTSFNVVLKGSSNFDGMFELGTGTSIPTFVQLACVNNSSNTSFQTESRFFSGLPTAATTYFLRVYDFRTGGGSNTFSLGVHTSSVSNTTPCASINFSNNLGKVAGMPTILSAYDKGVGGGLSTDTAANPPSGPNIVYFAGSTAYATPVAGAPLPSCGTPGISPKRVWYSFVAPALGSVDLIFRTNYGATSNNLILEAYTAAAVACPGSFTSLKCSNNGTLRLNAADLAPYAGQKMYIQLTEDGGNNYGVDYLLAIQAVAPSITVTNINTNGFTVNFPTGMTNLSYYRVYYRKQGTGGYNTVDYPSTATTAVINNLEGPANYDVWVAYFNSLNPSQVFNSPTVFPVTLSGCSGALPAPTVGIAPPPNLTCSKALIKWPSFANVAATNKYILYYRLTTSSGYNVVNTNDTFAYVSGLGITSSYEFYYKARCASGSVLTSASTMHTTCLVPTVPMTAIPFRVNSTATDSFNSTGQTGTGWAGCGGGNPDDDMYFSFTKPIGYLTFNVVLEGSSNYDGMFEIGTGTNPTNFKRIDCVNNSSNTSNQIESKLFTLQPYAATTYYIRVYDYRAGGGSNKFNLSVYTSTTANPNSIPCNSIDGSSATAKIAGSPTELRAFDNGTGGGLTMDTAVTPPSAPNLVYWTGSTAFASYIGGAPIPSCGVSIINPRRVWYSFKAPSLGNVDIVLRTTYGGTSGANIMEALTAPAVPCPSTFSVLKCTSNGNLRLSAAELAAYAGQKIYVQLSEGGGTANGINYMLAIQAIAPSISASAVNTNGFTVNLPSGMANLSKYKVYYRKQGTSGYNIIDVPVSTTSVSINNLVGASNYEVWVAYYNSVNSTQIYYSPTIVVSTLAGCAGTLPAPTAGIAPLPNTSCTKALITWPSFAGAGTSLKYRFYYRLTPSSGYYVIALNDTFIHLSGLTLNGNYEFFYKAICPSGSVLSGVSTLYANCGTPKSNEVIQYGKPIVISGVTYSPEAFQEIALASENRVPEDGQMHYVDLENNSMLNTSLNVYPNPASQFVNVSLESVSTADVTVQIYQLDGRLVYSKSLVNKDEIVNPLTEKVMIEERIDLTEFNSGLYILKVTENGGTIGKQLVVNK